MKPFVSSLNHEFQEVIHRIETIGTVSAPRGQKVKELEMATLEISPVFAIPEFGARKFNWKYFAGELAWYLEKDNHIGFISQFSNFWGNIASTEGYINSNYGKLLFGSQLQWALDSLKKDKNTRQAVCFLNQPKFQYEGNKDFVCTMYLNFWIRDNKLNMKVQMRSNDIFYGLSYDAPFFSFVMQTMWHWLKPTYEDLALGTYYHCADNIHFYERHFELAEKIRFEELDDPTYFLLKEPLFTLNDGVMVYTLPTYTFFEGVNELINNNTSTQEDWKKLISTIFYLQ
jgi:thymidylate synthase